MNQENMNYEEFQDGIYAAYVRYKVGDTKGYPPPTYHRTLSFMKGWRIGEGLVMLVNNRWGKLEGALQ